MENKRDSVGLVHGIGFNSFIHTDYVWHRLFHARRLDYELCTGWDTSAESLEALRVFSTVLLENDFGSGPTRLIVDAGGVLCSAQLFGRRVSAQLASRHSDLPKLQQVLDALRAALPALERDDDKVPIRFWLLDGDGRVQSRTRLLECPEWKALAVNYTAATRDRLEKLMALTSPPDGGQLILWHGLPGTGKTWALQALAKSWARWCQVEYVTDPERFLGSSHYLIETLLDRGLRGSVDDSLTHRLFVLEDTGELLTADAKSRVGTSLTRFLNVVDGFIGRGLPILVLVTANEELGELHHAVARPGRCADMIEFNALNADEANDWLETRMEDAPLVEGPTHVSDLFAIASRYVRRTSRRRTIGFSVSRRDGDV